MAVFARAVLGIALALASMLSVPAMCEDRLGILAIGQVMPGESPIPQWFDADPLVSYVLIPTDIDVMGGRGVAGERVMEDAWRRYIRIYFPKTRKELLDRFDFFVFPDGYIEPFTTSQIADMAYAIQNGVGCFVTMGGDLAAPTHKAYPGWKTSTLYDALPVELDDRMKQVGNEFQVRVTKTDPPVLSMFLPLGIEKVVGGGGFTHLFTREGATVWGKMKSQGIPSGYPDDWLVSRRFGEASGGLVWAVADDLDHPWWSSVHILSRNEYAMDIFTNLLLYSTGRKLPEDVMLVHEVRRRYWQYNQEKVLLLSLLEFVDRFGANTRVLEQEIANVDQLKEGSFEAYRSQDFEDALDSISKAIGRVTDIANDAMRLKDRALLWVYVTEWLAVAGTLMASGSVVYSLLVRRRLYREVEVTRARLR